MAKPVDIDPIALILPGYAFYVSLELAAGVGEILESRGLPWISISGGYLKQEREHVGRNSDFPWAEGQSNWIYDFLPNMDFSAAIIYGGGLGFNSLPEHLRRIVDSLGDMPMVNVGSTGLDIPCVNANNYQAMFQLVDEIAVQLRSQSPAQEPTGGHAPVIAFLAGPRGNTEAEDRLQAYSDALSKNGIDFDPDLVLQGDFTSDSARVITAAFLDSGDVLPDAIICANDLSAFGVSEVLRERDISIPRDMIITGFDDFEYAAAMYPSLTTVHFPIREMGREAARILLELLDQPGSNMTYPARDVNIPAFTVFRESTGHKLKRRQVARAREMLLFDMRAKERAPFRSMFTKILLEGPRLKDIMPDLMNVLPDCGIHGLLVMLYTRSAGDEPLMRVDDGFIKSESGYHRVEPDSHMFSPSGPICPQDLFSDFRTSGERMHLCPLQHEEEHLGYILVSAAEVALDFPEMIAYQLSGYLYRWRLIRQSEKHRAEIQNMLDELQKMQIQLDNVERLSEMGRLIAGVGHELNTPVGSSLTLASFLADRTREVQREIDGGGVDAARGGSGIPGGVRRFLEQTGEAADSLIRNLYRTSELIDTFRSLAVDPAEQRVRDFFLYQVLDVSLQRFYSMEGFDFGLTLDCPENLDLTNDAEAIGICFDQLLDNSMVHSYGGSDGGPVEISVASDEERVEIRYRDYGSVSEELEQSRIFEPFYTTGRANGCTGLGLHIVHNLVQYRLKGVITVSRHDRGGMEFIISIPRRLTVEG